MTKAECWEKINKLTKKEREECEAERKRLAEQGTPRVGLDGPKLEAEKKYKRIYQDLISQIDDK